MNWIRSLWRRLRGHSQEDVAREMLADAPGFKNIPIRPMEAPFKFVSDRDLLPEHERQLFDQLAPAAPEKEIRYPAPTEQTTQDWVTERLKQLTGGMTRHPFDLTDYPEPPNEVDLAARDWAREHHSGPRALFTHGYSMHYLRRLLERAEQRDTSLTAEELMAIRSRGLS